jgi:hypothetical protein
VVGFCFFFVFAAEEKNRFKAQKADAYESRRWQPSERSGSGRQSVLLAVTQGKNAFGVT